jgi:hypothetical protein
MLSTERQLRRSTARVLGGVAIGAGYGAATSLSNAAVAPPSPDSLARVPSLILDAGWAWAAVAVLAGWLAGAPVRAAAAGASALLAGTVVYYAMDSVLRARSRSWSCGRRAPAPRPGWWPRTGARTIVAAAAAVSAGAFFAQFLLERRRVHRIRADA